MNIFQIVGDDFFLPMTSKYRAIYCDCLNIIFDCYRTELSYGVEREVIMQSLLFYFDELSESEIYIDEDEERLTDSRQKAAYFLRRLKQCHWIESEIGSDQKNRIIMPNHAVEMLRTFGKITGKKETEYQSKIAAVFSTLNNFDLMHDPYPLVIKPVFDLTVELFTALKQLNTSIKSYIETLTADKSAEEIIKTYLQYNDEIGSKAYHRLLTSDNISRFRNNILSKLDEIRSNRDTMEKVAWGYQRIEGCDDIDTAREESLKMITGILDYYNSYDALIAQITEKHTKYLNQTVKRAKFLLTNTNNVEGKINTILRYLSESCNRDFQDNIDEDAPDELCALFNIFPQGFISEESIMTMPISRKITDVEEVLDSAEISEEEKQKAQRKLYAKYKNRFSRKNIDSYVINGLLADKTTVKASDIPCETKRDMIRIAFIHMYGQDLHAAYMVTTTENIVSNQGFVFRDFEVRRKTK